MNGISIQNEVILVHGEPLATVLYEPEVVESDVVLVHGFTGSKEDFTEISLLLAQQGHRVLTFDNRGQHESGHTYRTDGYSMHSLARDVIELVEKLGFNKPHLMGHSFGGLVSQKTVISAPELWSSLTLFCSGPSGKKSWFGDPHFENLTNENKVEKWEKYLDQSSSNTEKYPLLKKRWIASDAVATMEYREHLRNFNSLIKEIGKLKISSHVVFGENDDVWPLTEQRAMAQELAAKVSVLPDCGHCPNEENPALTAGVLSQFWKSVK